MRVGREIRRKEKPYKPSKNRGTYQGMSFFGISGDALDIERRQGGNGFTATTRTGIVPALAPPIERGGGRSPAYVFVTVNL